MTDELKQWEYDRGYDNGKLDGIDLCIALFREWQPRLATNVAEFGDALERLKEQNNDRNM